MLNLFILFINNMIFRHLENNSLILVYMEHNIKHKRFKIFYHA